MWVEREVWVHQEQDRLSLCEQLESCSGRKGVVWRRNNKKSDGKSGIKLLKAEGGGDLNLDVYAGGKDVK